MILKSLIRIIRFLTGSLIIIIAASLQNSSLLNIGGVKPNLILVLVMILAVFIEDFWEYMALSLVAITSLKFFSGFEKEIFWLLTIFLLAFYLKKILIRKNILNNVFLIIFATLVFYLLSSLNFVIHSTNFFVTEVVYNVFIGMIIYLIADFIYEKTKN